MMESWSEPDFTIRGRVRFGMMGGFGTWLGVISAILGVIGDATNTTLGLESMSWFLLAIASLLFGLSCWLGWVFGLYLHVKEKEGKK
jgi:hypothetical protein